MKLIIVGLNPANNDYSIGVVENEIPFVDSTELKTVVELSQKFIKAPVDWYTISKQTFLVVDKSLYLIYSAVVPQNLTLQNAKWLSFNQVDSLSDVDRQIVMEGVRL